MTLSHYDTPLYLEELGGWENRDLIGCFEKYCQVVFEEYKDLVTYWLTFNEINSNIMIRSFLPAGCEYILKHNFIKLHNQMVASAKVVKYAHDKYPQFNMGCMIAGMTSYPLTCDPKDILYNQHRRRETFYYAADVMVRGYYPSYAKRMWDDLELDENIFNQDNQALKDGIVDFFSFSYYQTSCDTTHKDVPMDGAGNIVLGAKNEYLQYSDWGWSMDLDGLRFILNEIHDRDQLPIMIVENGLGAIDTLENDG